MAELMIDHGVGVTPVKRYEIRRVDSDYFTVYAWTYDGDDGKPHHLAVLGVPPINSAQDAVEAAVVAHVKKQGQ